MTTGRRRSLEGIAYAVAASAMFAVLDSLAKYLARSYPAPMVAWIRYLFHVLVMLAVLGPRLRGRLVATRLPFWQAARGVSLAMSSLTFFLGLSWLPQAEATAVIAIAPILVTLAAVAWLGERAPAGTGWALAASFAGVLLIVRPGTAIFTPAAVFPLLAAVSSASYMLITRRLANVDEGVATLFIGAVVAAITLSAVVPFAWQMPARATDLLLFVVAGTLGACSHLLLVRAYEAASATTLAPYAYAHPVAALPMAWLVFGTFPDALALAGMVLIVATGVLMAAVRHMRVEPIED